MLVLVAFVLLARLGISMIVLIDVNMQRPDCVSGVLSQMARRYKYRRA